MADLQWMLVLVLLLDRLPLLHCSSSFVLDGLWINTHPDAIVLLLLRIWHSVKMRLGSASHYWALPQAVCQTVYNDSLIEYTEDNFTHYTEAKLHFLLKVCSALLARHGSLVNIPM